jgi:hypothetical protein
MANESSVVAAASGQPQGLAQMSIPIGEVLRDVGMARTLDAEPQTWLTNALEALRLFASRPEWSTFKLEDFRAWYAVQPHDAHVWGAFTTKACKAGVIRWTGRYANSVSPKTHAHPVKVWEAA